MCKAQIGAGVDDPPVSSHPASTAGSSFVPTPEAEFMTSTGTSALDSSTAAPAGGADEPFRGLVDRTPSHPEQSGTLGGMFGLLVAAAGCLGVLLLAVLLVLGVMLLIK